MTDGPVLEPLPEAATPADAAGDAPGGTLLRFVRLGGAYWNGADRWKARLLTALLVVLGILQVLLVIRFNLWSADLFDALERRDARQVLIQALVFAAIVIATMLVNAAHLEVRRRLQMGWRHWLTMRVADGWLDRGRQHQLALVPGAPGNPDARIADDIRLATEATIELANSLFYCLLLLVSFVSILWGLSGTVTLALGGITLELPGYLVGLALVYAAAGVAVAFLLGRSLVHVTDLRQSAEAGYRFGLVRDVAQAEEIALLGSEANERRRLRNLFRAITASWQLQTQGLRRLTLFTSAYGTMAAMFPVLVAAPRYLAGELTLGGLMQTAQAFQQVTAALSWPVDNFPRLAETMASMERVLALQAALDTIEAEAARPGIAIDVVAASGGTLTFRDLTIADAGGAILFSGISTDIHPGERVLLLGDPRLARALFKVVARVWPWGRGRVELPDDAAIHFLPSSLHLPADTLRAILAYPDDPETLDGLACMRALARVGLEDLTARLDTPDDWMLQLDASQRQRIGFARILLKRPSWIFLEEPGESLDSGTELALMQVIAEALPSATLLTASHHAELEAFYGRTLRFEPAADGRVFVRDSGERAAGDKAAPRWPAIEVIRRGFGEDPG
ncbi:putative ATP-binding cassette transporter [Stella humosa]|uniref:Putative ATP-binding cassette transporter n=1 Tax=Stella humosa TaxID=94 RepID=A0A3N1M9A2_9PROT|nr:SbmA/BacA-like family transporter [Stella humosa]ROQ00263.1 putative ATP-binding cassette transporter [Stella humosa]BBK30499.1 ATP-binding protein [Stella humosa]